MAVKIIILHGWGQNTTLWQDLATKLGKNALAFDLPGFGKEPIVDPDWGVPEYANWVIKKIEKYKDIIIIGHSFGGRIATEIASKRPGWLKGLILSGSPSIYRPSLKTLVRIYLSKIIKLFVPKKILAKYLPNDIKNAISRGLEKTFRKAVVYDQTKNLTKIDVPTLLIWGENDDEAPLRIGYEIHHLVKNSELKVIDHVGHNSFQENPNLFYSYVKKFIENIK